MRKVTSSGQMVKAIEHLMSVQPEDGAMRMMFETAIDEGDTTKLYWLVHNSDCYRVSGLIKAWCKV